MSEQRLDRRNIFSPSVKITLMLLEAYTGFSDRLLVEHLNGNIHCQMFCGIMIDPFFPITTAIRNEINLVLTLSPLGRPRMVLQIYEELGISHPRNKYGNVTESYRKPPVNHIFSVPPWLSIFVPKTRFMMTREEVAAVIMCCKEHKATYKSRLTELNIPVWRFYDSESCYAEEQSSLKAIL